MRSERCRVVVKARPTFDGEEESLNDVLSIPAPGRLFLGKEFEADRVYLPADGEEAVYHDEVKGLVNSLYEGFNATVFAYGASGSGKTHTIIGCRKAPGLVNRVIDDIFERYDQTCTLTVSTEELYCERFTDLLAPADVGSRRSVHFKMPNHASQVNSRYSEQKVVVTNAAELKKLMHDTLRKRHTATTCINEKSSRSHVIITLALERKTPVFAGSATASSSAACSGRSSPTSSNPTSRTASSDLAQQAAAAAGALESGQLEDTAADCGSSDDCAADAVCTYLMGKLYLVDLAGSENIKRSGAEGKQLKEAGEINKSLCHLKTVIEEVFKGSKVATYRNSKLTQRLKDALGGGNSKLLVVACISTARANLAETKETLRFAEMARSITNTPIVNREPKDELIQRLQRQVEELQEELARRGGGGGAAEALLQAQLNAVEAAYAELQEDMEVNEKKWADDTKAHQQQSTALQQQMAQTAAELSAVRAKEAALQQQVAANQSEMQQLHKQLQHEQRQLRDAQSSNAESLDLLREAGSDVLALRSQCTQLQQQLAAQHAAAEAATRLCSDHQQQAVQMQQQLADQAGEMDGLQQLLELESAARSAAESTVAELEQQLQQEAAARADAERTVSQLDQQLQQDSAVRAEAETKITSLELQLQQEVAARNDAQQLADQLKQQLQQEEAARADAEEVTAELEQQLQLIKAARAGVEQRADQLEQQLQQEVAARAAAEQNNRQLELQLEQMKTARAAVEQDARRLEQQLQQEVAATAAAQQVLEKQLATARQEAVKLRQQLQVESRDKLCAVSALSAAQLDMQQMSVQVLAMLQQQLVQQVSHQKRASSACSSAQAGAKALQQEMQQQVQQHQAERQAAADQAAQVGAQQQLERENWRHAIETAKSSIAQLQKQIADEKAAHSAELAEIQQRHADLLEASLQHSVQKAAAEKLRCKEHLQLQVHNLMADAASLSEALSTTMPINVPDTPTTTLPGVPGGLQEGQQGEGDDQQQLQQQQQLSRRCSNEQGLQGDAERSNCSAEEEQQGAGREGADAGQEGLEGDDNEDGSSCSSDSLLSGSSVSLASAYLAGGSQHELGESEAAEELLSSDDGECSDSGGADDAADEAGLQQLALGNGGEAAAQQHLAAGAAAAAAAAAAVAAAAAAAANAYNCSTSSSGWPLLYRPQDELGEQYMAAAVQAFADVGGGELKVETLLRFLKQRTLGGHPHSSSVLCGSKKRKKNKSELVQDMMAWYQLHMLDTTPELSSPMEAAAAAAGRSSSMACSSSSGSPAGLPSYGASSAPSEASSSCGGLPHLQPFVCSSAGGSSAGVIETIDLCTPDTAKAAAAAAAAAAEHSTPRSDQKTPRGVGLSPAAAGSTPVSGSKWKSWFSSSTPRSSKKKQAAAAAADGGGGVRDCDVIPSGHVHMLLKQQQQHILAGAQVEEPALGLDAHQQQQQQQRQLGSKAGPLVESVTSRASSSSTSSSAVAQFLLSEPEFGSPAVPLSALMAAGIGAGAGSCAGSRDAKALATGAAALSSSGRRSKQVKATSSRRG